MHPAIREYYQAPDGSYLPPDPCPADICVHRVCGETVYSVLPMSTAGRSFVLDHADAGSVHGDVLLVPHRGIFPFMNEVFDMGLRVV